MKKKIAMLLFATMVVSVFAACGEKATSDVTTEVSAKAAQEEQADTVEASTEVSAESDAEVGLLDVLTANTMEEFFELGDMKEQVKAEMDSIKEASAGVYSDISVEAKGNTLTYKYVFAQALPAETDWTAFEDSMKESAKTVAEQMKSISMIKDPITVEFVFENPDGTVAFELSETN